jgi:hypothetical protein
VILRTMINCRLNARTGGQYTLPDRKKRDLSWLIFLAW